MQKIFNLTVCTVILAMLLGGAQVEADTWQLTQSNVSLGESGNFVSVTISVTGDTATFTVTANTSLLVPHSNFGIDKFGLNTTLSSITPSDFSVQSGWSVKTNQTEDGFGNFDFEIKGNGSHRAQPLTFSITDPSINSASQFVDTSSGGYYFASEVAGFQPLNWQTSAFFGSNSNRPVPTSESSSILLLSSGLAGIVVFRKLKGKRKL